MRHRIRSSMAAGMLALIAWAAAPLQAQQRPLPEGYVPPGVPAEIGHAPSMRVHEAAPATLRTFELSFSAGDELMSGLTELAQRYGITAGYLTGIGGLAGIVLGWGDPEVGGIKMIPVDQQCELVSLVGNFSVSNGKPFVHAHAVVALSDGSTRGGHVFEARVAPLAEVTVVATQFAGSP